MAVEPDEAADLRMKGPNGPTGRRDVKILAAKMTFLKTRHKPRKSTIKKGPLHIVKEAVNFIFATKCEQHNRLKVQIGSNCCDDRMV